MARSHAAPTFRPWIPAYLVVWVMLCGCGQSTPDVRQYEVPKPSLVESQNPGNYPDRLLGAIIPRQGSFWFFKLAGPADGVSKQLDNFRKLVESVTFEVDSQESGTPEKAQWKLPDGWEEQKGGASQLRFATLKIPGEKSPLETTVTVMPVRDEGLGPMLANINRWRNQMGRRPIGPVQLRSQLETVKLADGQAMLVDIKGEYKPTTMPLPGMMQPPSAGTEK